MTIDRKWLRKMPSADVRELAAATYSRAMHEWRVHSASMESYNELQAELDRRARKATRIEDEKGEELVET